MPDLKEISGIGKASIELLKAAGIGDAAQLSQQNAETLNSELKRANGRAPGVAIVRKWISGAINLLEKPPEVEPAAAPLNYEANLEVAAMLDNAPCAIPLAGKKMMERQLRVADVPAGLLLNRYSGDLDVRVADPDPSKTQVPSRRGSGNMDNVSTPSRYRHFDASNLRSTAEEPNGKARKKSNRNDETDRVALIRGPLEKTNRGKDPNSRRFVRGVLHTHPFNLRLGAIFSLLLLINLPLAVISAFLLLVSDQKPEAFPWVPGWILYFPIALPIVGLCYFIWGMSGKCRICTQKLFVHKGALKHTKSHRIPGLGYVVPLALHLLLFNWFRCSSCGTPVRLKK